MYFKIAAMTSTTLLWILVALFKPSYQESISYGACLNDGSVPAPTLPCEPRDVVIQLDLPNNSYFHVAPDHVTVKRCIGSCNFDRHKSCIPTDSGVIRKTIPVLLFPYTDSSGLVPHECSTVTIEEHQSCQCGCAKTAQSCTSSQVFRENQCSCVCKDEEAKNACYNRPGWFWDEDSCQCLCQCQQNGYFYNSCDCISVSAEPALIITVVILISVILTLGGTLFHCYRKNIGIFGRKKRAEVKENFRKVSEDIAREFNVPLVEDEKSQHAKTPSKSSRALDP